MFNFYRCWQELNHRDADDADPSLDFDWMKIPAYAVFAVSLYLILYCLIP